MAKGLISLEKLSHAEQCHPTSYSWSGAIRDKLEKEGVYSDNFELLSFSLQFLQVTNSCKVKITLTKGSFQNKKQPNIWKFPYVGGRGGSGGGPFPYVFTIVLKCILSHSKPF